MHVAPKVAYVEVPVNRTVNTEVVAEEPLETELLKDGDAAPGVN